MFDYISRFGSNVLHFTKAGYESVSALWTNEGAAKITMPLFETALADFLPAIMAFEINETLQEILNDYQEEISEEYFESAALGVAAASVNVVFMSYILRNIMRGGIRLSALLIAIPYLVKQGILDEDPSSEPVESGSIRIKYLRNMMRAGIRLSELPSSESFEDESMRIKYLLGEHFIEESLNAFFPEAHILHTLLNLSSSYALVESALGGQAVRRLNRLKINSLPLLVAGARFLMDLALQNNTNPYLSLLIDNIVFVGLFTIIANMRLDSVNLEHEGYSLNPSSIVTRLKPVKITQFLLKQASRKVSPQQLQEIAMQLTEHAEQPLLVAKLMGLPKMMLSPEKFFNDSVIRDLLEALPGQTRVQLMKKYSPEQIKLFLNYFETTITKTRPKYTPTIYNFFLKPWAENFQNKVAEISRANDGPVTRCLIRRRDRDEPRRLYSLFREIDESLQSPGETHRNCLTQ
ncbi:hypothetical protein [Legionella jamestowniensis]|uniref:Uncharacterized protein n=1 Tax=Legionella jamestowniensis TaxID=455 RepID=A0A0W0UK62_9GAMM|nr:hypothetical protein [Legionella jamestowniensis]KTD08013.1 hypothetical protein Ljam_2208 [Legionella jamestowniensis]OCH97302.1 hypothetical protein A8135_03325 [Legionella jamestowniensis]SFM06601.1 hypothetical protein SAMN02746073_0224 [Legionella jamestowniensis DSM 19215]